MNSIKKHNAMKNLLTCLILAGMALTGLSAAGCDEQQVKDFLGIPSDLQATTADQPPVADQAETTMVKKKHVHG